MKISSSLPQFENETALILVTGTEELNVFVARNGVVNSVFHFVLEKIKFSDREDSARCGAAAFETGAKIELVKKVERLSFIKSFKSNVTKIAVEQKADSIFLFTPDSIKNDLKKSLPVALQKKIRGVYLGNFCKENLLDIIKKIRPISLKSK